MKLLIATFNKGKLEDYKRLLGGLLLEVIGLEEAGIKDEFDEIYGTFEENSKEKAKFYSEISKLPVIADDSGVEIPFYNMEPGVKTKRWGGDLDESEYFSFVLKKIKQIPGHQRQAQMRAVLTLCCGENCYQKEGKILGVLTDKPYEQSATSGYPWDRVFILDANGKYYEALNDEENQQLNHRKVALDKLKKYLLA